MEDNTYLFTSESVSEGHPDKVCDQVSDAVLDAMLKDDPNSRVACECFATTGMILVGGEITTETYVDLQSLVRSVIEDIGYTKGDFRFESHSVAVINVINHQSPDIWHGEGDQNGVAGGGAGDQGMMFGYACNETDVLMPMPIHLSHLLTKRLSEVRKNGTLPWVRPDGKAQVTVEYSYGKPVAVRTVLVSTQHADGVSDEEIVDGIIEHVIRPVIPADLVGENRKVVVNPRSTNEYTDDDLTIYINPTGRFVIGGPMGDAGVTGRKIIVDTYGGMGRHGGGAFSGKDPTKVDRSAAYAARWVAKNLVAAGLAERCEVQVAYAIGVAHPLSVNVETFGTSPYSSEQLVELIESNFDLRPGAIIRDLDLRRPIYRATAAYGHFGRNDIEAPWENTDKAEQLREAAQSFEPAFA